jgi:hypothetical protein
MSERETAAVGRVAESGHARPQGRPLDWLDPYADEQSPG